jgi:CubicO group peptidase (beta-lactamase class C family)
MLTKLPCLVLIALLLSTGAWQPVRAQNPGPGTGATATSTLSAADYEALALHAFATYRPTGMAMAVVQDGKILFEIGLGTAGPGRSVTPGTLFNIASCTKAFTAALVAQLVEQGKLEWDDRVVDILAEFRMQDPWITSHMTVRDLLCHRCGLVTFAGDLLWYGSDYTDEEILRRIEQLPIKQQFRSEFGYQNLMYLVAGLVLQKVTGQPWEELVEQRIMRPLGMELSVASAQRLPDGAEIALPHIDGAAIEDHEFRACRPAASIYSSVHELSSWIAALTYADAFPQGSRILDTRSFDEIWKPHVTVSPERGGWHYKSYGLGWFLELNNGNRLVEHDGGMPGFLSKITLVPADRFGFVILNNGNDGILNEAMKRAVLAARAGGDGKVILDRIAVIKQRIDAQSANEQKQRESKRRQDTSPRLPLDAYAGRYTDAIYGDAQVEMRDDGLHVKLVPSQRRLFGAMKHWHDDVFRVDFPDKFLPFALFRFELDFDGKVAGMRIECPIADFDFGALDFRRQP